MVKKYLFIILLITISLSSFGQATGDFQSITSGTWSSNSSWQTWNGAWIPATSYPGQFTGTNSVTIQAGHTITFASNLTTFPMGTITVKGTLTVNPTPSPNTINLDTTTLIIDGASAILDFVGVKARLNLVPSNATLTLLNGGTITAVPCNNNYEILINSRTYAACAGGGSKVYTFGDVNSGGGTVNAVINNPSSSPITICYGNQSLNGGYTGPDNNVTYTWTARNRVTGELLANSVFTPTNTGTLVNNTQTIITTFTPPLGGGEFLISFAITSGSFTNIETRILYVQDVPTAGAIGTAQIICSGTTPAMLTSTTDGTGSGTISYEWIANGGGSSLASSATYSPPALSATTSYQRRTVSTLNGTACYSAYTTSVIISIETTPPAINCPDNISVNNTTGTCGAVVTYTAPVGTDNCSGATTTQTAGLASGATFPVGVTTNTFRVTDAAGLQTSCSFTVTVVDNQVPTMTCPADISVNNTTGTCGAVVTYSPPVGTDNCSGATTTQTAGLASGATFPVGVTTNTFRVTDAAGLQTSCSFTVTVVDNQVPTMTCPADITVNNTTGTCGAVVTYSPPVGTDNCSGATTTQTAGLASGATFPVGVTTNTFRVTDAAGLQTSCSFTVTVVDNQVPTMTCPADITTAKTSNDGTGNCTTTVALGNPSVSDNCTAVGALVVTNNAPVNFPIGLTVVTWTVKDTANNTTTCTQNVTVADDEAPSITCPAAIATAKTSNDGTGNCTTTVSLGSPIVSDNCTAVGALVVTNNAPVNFPIGLTVVTWTVKDTANNTTTCTQNVTVADDEAPSITCPAAIATAKTSNDGTGNCTTTVSLGSPIVSDNCTAVGALVVTNNAPVNFPIGLTVVTWTVKDAANNTTTCTQNVTVADDEAPSITCPAAIATAKTSNDGTGNCTTTVSLGSPIVSDNCTAVGALVVTNNAPVNFPIGLTVVTWTVKDAANNTTTCTQNVTVADDEAPSITCPAAIATAKTSNDGTGNCTTTVSLGSPIVSDNCTAVGALVVTNNAPVNFPIGLTVVTWTVKDAANNTTTCTQNVTVADDEAPSIACPAAIATAKTSNDGTGNCTTTVSLGSPTVSDNCTAVGALVVTNNAPVNFPIGLTVVTWTVKDAANNTTTCTQNVTVADDEAPSITCPAAIATAKTSNDGTGNCTTTVSLGSPIVSDNCTAVGALVVTNNAPVNFPIGLTVVTWTVKDAANNTTTCTQNVTVADDEAPSITCPAAIATAKTSNDGTGNCTTTVSLGSPIVSDNCTAVGALVVTNNAPVNFPIGLTVVTWTVKDAANNTTTCTQNVTVADDEAPSITCPAAIATAKTSNDGTGNCTTTVSLGSPIVSDNCTAVGALVVTNNAPVNFPIGLTVVTWTVKDAANNTTTCTQNVTVADDEAPSITCPANISVNNTPGTCGAAVTYTAPVGTDNCTGAITIQTAGLASGATFPVGITTNTFRVTDAAGLQTSCSFTATVTDNENPTASNPGPIVAKGSAPQPDITLVIDEADNCTANPVVAFVSDTASGSCPVTVTRVYSVTDNAGNTINVSQTITVNDAVLPVARCIAPYALTITLDGVTGEASILASQINNGSTDNCDANPALSLDNYTFGCNDVGEKTVILTVTDSQGNKRSCSTIITVNAPAIDSGTLTGWNMMNGQTPDKASNVIELTACPVDSIGKTIAQNVELNLKGIDPSLTDNINRWEFSTNGGVNWSTLAGTTNTTNTYTLVDVKVTTLVRTVIDVGNCLGFSPVAIISVIPPDIPPTITNGTANNTICLGDAVTVIVESAYGVGSGINNGGLFNQANLNNLGWIVDEEQEMSAGGNNTNDTYWKETNGPKTFNGRCYDVRDNTKFAIVSGVPPYINQTNTKHLITPYSTLETPVFSALGLTAMQLEFDQAYYLQAGAWAKIEISTDGGATYDIELDPGATYDYTGPSSTNFNDILPGGQCKDASASTYLDDHVSIDLQPYIGLTNLRIKFTYYAGKPGDNSGNSSWAIDNIQIPNNPINEVIQWTDDFGVIVTTGSTVNITPVTPGIQNYGATSLINGCRSDDQKGTEFINIKATLSYAGENIVPIVNECGEDTVRLKAYDNTIGAQENFEKGTWDGKYKVPNATTPASPNYPGTGEIGEWTVEPLVSLCNAPDFAVYTLSDKNDPNAIFTGEPGKYTLTWTVNGCASNVLVTINSCDQIDFDGINDYITFKDNYDKTGPFSIEMWVKAGDLSGTQSLLSKRNANNLSTGYDLSLNGNNVTFNWGTSNSISSNSIDADTWHHIAVTFNGTIYKLYIDGVEKASKNGSAPTANNMNCILGAMDQANKPVNYYHGWIDELRIWNKGLDVEHIRQMMNQEIKLEDPRGGDDVMGEVIPLRIHGPDSAQNGTDDAPLRWSDLDGYYRMDLNCGYLTPYKGSLNGRLINIFSPQQETAPLPYTTIQDGDWNNNTTWTYGNVWYIPNSTVHTEKIDWNIVKTSNNLIAGHQDLTLLGLLVDSGELTITNTSGNQDETNDGQGLWITHYLKLDGMIDLVGESQLLQKRYGYYDATDNNFDNYITTQFSESIFAETSSGSIERDQQGKQNSYNYNYWSSPVSIINPTANNLDYSVSAVLRDGLDSSKPEPIVFGNGAYFADGALTSPIKISNRWIWSYNSLTPDNNTNWQNYYRWQYKANTGLIGVAEGFSMKGSGGNYPIETLQNYVFTGKPNSGTISLFLAIDQTYLVGNPYPSALDANEFIKDNLKDCDGCRGTANTFGGVLYFWDHFGLSKNHILAQYEGGYAAYTLMGRIEAISANDPLTANTGNKGKNIPERYIPVAQGFFIDAAVYTDRTGTVISTSVDGGFVIFKNSQRALKRETLGSSQFMKTSVSKKSKITAPESVVDSRQKIRLGFDSTIGTHRQLLVGVDSNTTNGFDIGYDAPMFGMNANDMYLDINNHPFMIEAVPDFNSNQIIPLGIVVDKEGSITIKIDALKNIPSSTEIYLQDTLDQVYHNLRESEFKISLAIGEYDKRFFLRFTGKTLSPNEESKTENGITIFYADNNDVLVIKNNIMNLLVNEVSLFNILGQTISNWEVESKNQTKIVLPVKNLSAGVYIVKMKTTNGELSKKIIIP